MKGIRRKIYVIFMLMLFSVRIFGVEFVKKNTKQEMCPVPKMVTGTTENMDKFNDVMSDLQAKILKYNKHRRDSNKILEEYVLEDDKDVQHLKYYIYKGLELKEDVGMLELIIDKTTGKLKSIKYTDYTRKDKDNKPVTYVDGEILEAIGSGLLIGIGVVFIVGLIALFVAVSAATTPVGGCCCGGALLEAIMEAAGD